MLINNSKARNSLGIKRKNTREMSEIAFHSHSVYMQYKYVKTHAANSSSLLVDL